MMANQRPIQQVEIRKSTFEWKIDRFLEQEDQLQSPFFKLGRCTSYFIIPKRIKTCTLCLQRYNVEVYSIKSNESLFSTDTFYKQSLIDRDGREFLTKKGIITEKVFSCLSFLRSFVEQHSEDLLPEGTLTIRLSWQASKEKDTKITPDSTTSEKEPVMLLETLSRDFSRFYESKTDTDCVLRVGDVQFPAHRQVLSARSTVFAAMFHHDTSENRKGVVDIPDVDGFIMSNVLHYIYSGQIRGLAASTAGAMFVVADKYDMIELRDVCRDFLLNNVTTGNICEAALLAHLHGECKLEEKVILFVQERLDDLEETDEWENLSKTNPFFANKLLRSALKVSKETIKKLSSK